MTEPSAMFWIVVGAGLAMAGIAALGTIAAIWLWKPDLTKLEEHE